MNTRSTRKPKFAWMKVIALAIAFLFVLSGCNPPSDPEPTANATTSTSAPTEAPSDDPSESPAPEPDETEEPAEEPLGSRTRLTRHRPRQRVRMNPSHPRPRTIA